MQSHHAKSTEGRMLAGQETSRMDDTNSEAIACGKSSKRQKGDAMHAGLVSLRGSTVTISNVYPRFFCPLFSFESCRVWSRFCSPSRNNARSGLRLPFKQCLFFHFQTLLRANINTVLGHDFRINKHCGLPLPPQNICNTVYPVPRLALSHTQYTSHLSTHKHALSLCMKMLYDQLCWSLFPGSVEWTSETQLNCFELTAHNSMFLPAF